MAGEGKSHPSPAVEALILERAGYLIRSTVILSGKAFDPELGEEMADGDSN